MCIYKKRSLYSETTFFKTHFVDYDEKIRTSSCFNLSESLTVKIRFLWYLPQVSKIEKNDTFKVSYDTFVSVCFKFWEVSELKIVYLRTKLII